MSKRDELKASIQSALGAVKDSIAKIKALTDHVPLLHERRMELEANSLVIDRASDVQIEEMYSKLLPLQRRDEESFTLLNTSLGEVTRVLKTVSPSTSGTASIYLDLAYTVSYDETPSPADPMAFGRFDEPLFLVYKDLADRKARKVEIPKRLSQLRHDLGQLFLTVHDNVEKAKNGIMTVKQAVSDMRDVLNQIWANLADWSEKRHPEWWKGITNKEFKKSANHKIVAECVIKLPEDRAKFELLLNNMYALYGEMSQTRIGKNPLSQDQEKLGEFYTRWVSQIDGVVGMIDWG